MIRGCLALEGTVDNAVMGPCAAGCSIERGDGTVVARDGDRVVYRALRKGAKGQPWIVVCKDSDRIKWEHRSGA